MNRAAYISELEIIRDNCEFTAEAHHHIASRHHRRALSLKVLPAVLAAATGVLVANDVFPSTLIWLTVTAAAISAIAGVLDPDRDYQTHLTAARAFTSLKHDARALKETYCDGMTDEQFRASVIDTHDRYNDLVRMTPPTDDASFAKAQKRIKSSVHLPTSLEDNRT